VRRARSLTRASSRFTADPYVLDLIAVQDRYDPTVDMRAYRGPVRAAVSGVR